MSQADARFDLVWSGPYSWPGFETESSLAPLPAQPGVYLMTVDYQDGYLIYAAGLTRRSIRQRLGEHTRKYMSGDYNVLEITAMQQGIRSEVWHGWGWSAEKRIEFEQRKSCILAAARKQLAGFRIFTVHVGTEPRLLERLEAAIMKSLYQQPSPFCDIPDKGMMLAPRRNSESRLFARNQCAAVLYGLPAFLEL
jgi:hypothetical protein